MVDSAGSMAPVQKETEARSLPLLTYSVLEKKIVSLIRENNFALKFASCGAVPSLCAPSYCSVLSPVDATVQLSRLADRVGATPRTFWAAEIIWIPLIATGLSASAVAEKFWY